jgi:hypothetical protein
MGRISARETLDFLSKSAPRPWVKRMLLWMIFNGELAPYFLEGRSVATTSAFSIINAFLQRGASKEIKSELIRQYFKPELAERLIALDNLDEFEDVVCEWDSDEGPREVSAGYFVYASDIDWSAGIVETEIYGNVVEADVFWDSDDLLNSSFKDADYVVTLPGLCFDRGAIEILQPTAELMAPAQDQAEGRARLGLPRSWDWDGAMTHLLAIAQTPDGLPTGPGAQAQIERAVADWFMTRTGNTPSTSQVRHHVKKIMRALKKPESP